MYIHGLEFECVGFLSFRDEIRFAIGRRMASHSPGSAFLRNRDVIADFEFETTSNWINMLHYVQQEHHWHLENNPSNKSNLISTTNLSQSLQTLSDSCCTYAVSEELFLLYFDLFSLKGRRDNRQIRRVGRGFVTKSVLRMMQSILIKLKKSEEIWCNDSSNKTFRSICTVYLCNFNKRLIGQFPFWRITVALLF